MFLLQNAIKNIGRQRKRYRVLVPLLVVCALLTGICMTIAVPCRMYAERIGMVMSDPTDDAALAVIKQNDHTRALGESATLIQYGILLIGAIGILYVSALMIGERMFDIGILYSIGLSRTQIFFTMFVELLVLCGTTIFVGLQIGQIVGTGYLKQQITQQILPEGLLAYMKNGTSELFCMLASIGILLLPILLLVIKLMHTDPNGFLRERK